MYLYIHSQERDSLTLENIKIIPKLRREIIIKQANWKWYYWADFSLDVWSISAPVFKISVCHICIIFTMGDPAKWFMVLKTRSEHFIHSPLCCLSADVSYSLYRTKSSISDTSLFKKKRGFKISPGNILCIFSYASYTYNNMAIWKIQPQLRFFWSSTGVPGSTSSASALIRKPLLMGELVRTRSWAVLPVYIDTHSVVQARSLTTGTWLTAAEDNGSCCWGGRELLLSGTAHSGKYRGEWGILWHRRFTLQCYKTYLFFF